MLPTMDYHNVADHEYHKMLLYHNDYHHVADLVIKQSGSLMYRCKGIGYKMALTVVIIRSGSVVFLQ